MAYNVFRGIKGRPALWVLLLFFFVPLIQSCGQVNKMTGVTELKKTKQNLQEQNQQLKQEVKECEQTSENKTDTISQLNATKHDLQTNLASLKKEKDDLVRKVKSLNRELNKLRQSKESGIRVSFFNGEIIYNILAKAYSDYRVSLRYKSIIDSEFANQLEKFNKGEGGDKAVLNVLKNIDKNNDQIINEEEASDYRQKIENKM